MADTPEPAALTPATTKMINPRAEIDTSPPFGSVKEAVTHFGGSGSWVPLHVLRLAAGHDNMDKVEKQTAELEKDLILKEQETLEVLKELEAAKGIVEGLKLNLIKEVSSFMASLDLSSDSGMSTPNENSTGNFSLCNLPSPGSILMDLKDAKLNLHKTTNDLSLIRASVESLNKKMTNHKNMLGRSNERQMPMANKEGELKRVFENSINLSRGLQEFNFEADQYKRMEEAAQYEVIKATSEIEQTKMSIKMVEMRLVAAKKLEEAARAMEAVALAEKTGDNSSKLEGITLSYEEYSVLTQKARKGEELSNKEVGDGNALKHQNGENLSRMAFSNGLEERKEDVKCRRKTLEEALGPNVGAANRRKLTADEGFFRERSEHGQIRFSAPNYAKNGSPHPSRNHAHREFEPLVDDEGNLFQEKSMPGLRSSVSIGDILNRKLIMQDDIVVGKHVESHTGSQEVSLSHMLREQSGLIFHDPRKGSKDGNIEKQFFTTRKKFGFIHVSLPLTRQSKKKTQPLNMR